MKCFHCGEQLEEGGICANCGADVQLYKKIIFASNAYYNEGLKKAEVRDLSGAIDSLKTSLRFYKMNTDARNLLGLVYFEMGEVVAALTEWVISKNYQPRENRASAYLEEIQNNPGRLESINQTIKKYNQALLYCRQNSRDLAIIQLKKVLSLNSKLVAGHQLLALLYIQENKFDLAKKTLRNAAKIDANNTVTLRYMREVNHALREQNPGKKQKNDELVSYQSGNETIIQPKYLKDNSAIITIVNMVIGIAIGAAAAAFLLLPGMRSTIRQEARAEVIEANNTITSKNQMISELEDQVEALTDEVEAAKADGETAANQLSTYNQLLLAYGFYTQEDIEAAGNALANVNEEYLSEDAKTIYDTINAQVNEKYLESLYEEGYSAYNSRNYVDAIENLQKVADIDETYEDGYAIYYLAHAYRINEDMEHAKIYYQRFVDLYPQTDRAATARTYLTQE